MMGNQESLQRHSRAWGSLPRFQVRGHVLKCCCRNVLERKNIYILEREIKLSKASESLSNTSIEDFESLSFGMEDIDIAQISMEQGNKIGGSDNGSSRTKHNGSENEQEDRISELPNSILIHILSFLPTEDAIKTLIIRRFSNLWSFTHNLDLDLGLYRDRSHRDNLRRRSVDESFVNLVCHALNCRGHSMIFKFHIRFPFPINPAEAMSAFEWYPATRKTMFDNEIGAWIGYALGKGVKVLDLDFLTTPGLYSEEYYKLPSFVFTSGSLTELKLVSCGVNLQAKIHMRSLKILSLRDIKLSEDTTKKILSGCPLLESLCLMYFTGLSELNITSQSLKNLMVVLRSDSRLEISCPYVTSLNISGWIEGVALKNVSSLIDATLGFTNYGYYACEYLGVRMILQKSHHVKVLTLCDKLILVLTKLELKRLPWPSSNWKFLTLKTRLTKQHLPGIASLLRKSPSLEMLTIYVHQETSSFYSVDDMWLQLQTDDDMWLQSYEIEGESFHCLMNNLKTVTICGYVTVPCVIQLVQFLLKSAMVLEKMVISTKGNTHPNHQNHFKFEKMQEFSEKLSKFPRASTHAAVLFSSEML